MFVVGSRLSQSTVLTASPALKDCSLSFCLLSGKFFSSPCTDHDRADWAVRRAASHNAAPVAGKRIQGHGRPETARHLLRHVTFLDLARMCELRRPACHPSVRNLE